MFSNCKNINEAKKAYRELLMVHHPDRGGDEDKCKQIVAAFELWIKTYYTDTARTNIEHENATREDFHFDFSKVDTEIFGDILKKIIHLNCNIEIIGYWIYCFDAFGVHDDLKALGFWFSRKHRAWIFNGSKKIKIRTKYTTDDVRAMHGMKEVREKEEQLKLQ